MKPLSVICSLAGIWALIACSEEFSVPDNEYSTVTAVFEARYTGINTNAGSTDNSCGPGYQRVIETGNGKGTFVGYSTLNSDFCFSVKELKVGYTYIKAFNGDTLFILCGGKTCQEQVAAGMRKNEHPDAMCSWNYQFVILGGTGLFKNAGGKGTMDDYICNENCLFHHQWKGTITLPKDVYDKLR